MTDAKDVIAECAADHMPKPAHKMFANEVIKALTLAGFEIALKTRCSSAPVAERGEPGAPKYRGLKTTNFNEVSCTSSDDCKWPECNCPRKPGAHSPEAAKYAFKKADELLRAEGFTDTAEILASFASPSADADAVRLDVIEECARVADGINYPDLENASDYEKQAYDLRCIIADQIRALASPRPAVGEEK